MKLKCKLDQMILLYDKLVQLHYWQAAMVWDLELQQVLNQIDPADLEVFRTIDREMSKRTTSDLLSLSEMHRE